MNLQFGIEVRHLSKKFARSLKRAMVYGLVDIAKAALIPRQFRSDGFVGRMSDASNPACDGGSTVPVRPGAERIDRAPDEELRPTEFWALRDVSFTLGRGDSIGIVGHNGAGKSTLFSLLSGIYGPTEGRITVRGRLQALIALGAGFHPMLSGRENIYINAAIMGMTGFEIEQRIQQIIDFSELGDFLDAPVRNYSSGMMVRLGFSVAAHLDPDILLIDEVLAVGDSRFQAKCQKYTRSLVDSGKSVMLVSHYMHNIQGMCSKALWMDHGRVVQAGDAEDVIRDYEKYMLGRMSNADVREREAAGGYAVIFESATVRNPGAAPGAAIDARKPVEIEFTLRSLDPIHRARFYLGISTAADRICMVTANMLEDGHALDLPSGATTLRMQFDPMPLKTGAYFLYVNLRNEDGTVHLSQGLTTAPFEWVNDDVPCLNGPGSLRAIHGVTSGSVHVPYRWPSDAR
jgi:lipopolysaccharide transport system ATP-binding protein